MFKIFVLACLVAVCAANPLFDNGRIVGGVPIDISEARHQVSLRTSGHICGGSIVRNRWVVTAAHCVAGGNPNSYSVRVGSTSRNSGGEVIQVKRIISHPKYNSRTIDYDYALLELASSINFDETRGPIKLATTEPKDNADAFVSGWGNTLKPEETSVYLRQAFVHIVNRGVCNKAYNSITTRMICAGEPEGGKDSCQGDSGGPLVVDGKLVGIVSWGAGCAQRGYPGVYSNVAEGFEWFEQYINE